MLIYIIKKLFSFLLLLGLLSIISVSVIYYSPNSPFHHLTFIESYYTFYQQVFVNQLISSSLSHYTLVEILRLILLPTFELCLLVIICSIIIGFPIGIISGLTNNHKFNHLIKLVCLVLYASPIIWIAILIISASSVNWEFIRNTDYSSTMMSSSLLDIFLTPNINKWNLLVDQVKYLLLPVMILTIQPCIITIQLVSERVNRIANKNYIKVASIRENSSLKVLFRHLLPNAIPGVIPQLTYNITTLLFSTMVIEIVLNHAGLGTWVFSAFYQQDFLIIAITILSCGILTCLLTLLSEILVVLIYPIQSRTLYE